MTQGREVIPFARIVSAIYSIRGLKVMLDRDLAALYGVETRALNQAVKRNRDRFPLDFMFDLTRDEIRNISQTVICSVTLDAMQQMTTVHSEPIGYQYVDDGDSESGAGKTVREPRTHYRTARKTKRSGKA